MGPVIRWFIYLCIYLLRKKLLKYLTDYCFGDLILLFVMSVYDTDTLRCSIIFLCILLMQASTDECIGLGPGEAYCYCWRTHKIKQVINYQVIN